MRISTDPSDPAFIDERPRRVWVNEKEIQGWITADEFRRCVVTAEGAIHGSVLIERLPEPGTPVVEAPAECVGGLSGVFVKVEEPAPAPSFAVPTVAVKPAAMKAPSRKKGKK